MRADTPRIWTLQELETHAQRSLDAFVDRRLREPEGIYQTHVRGRRAAIRRLFRVLSAIDPAAPDPAVISTVIADEELFAALRYIAGPPVSEDDLGVLVQRNTQTLSAQAVRRQPDLAKKTLELICRLADPYRFPWVAQRRRPTSEELRRAVTTTSILHASQSLQTERRGYGRAVELLLEQRLVELGFAKVAAVGPRERKANEAAGRPTLPPGGKISQPSHHPTYPHFYGECTVYGRKVDLFIALKSGRMIALEAKDSSSAINSTKRLLNDTAAKAKHYNEAGGKIIISVALLSGVFKISDLVKAQEQGLFLVWAHELDEFVDWIKDQR